MHVYRVTSRWGDEDAYQHINNGMYVDYLQEARVDFLLDSPVGYMLGHTADPAHEREGVLVANHQIEYLAQVRHGEDIEVRLRVDSVGAARFSLSYDVVASGQVAVRARTVLCPFDLASNKLRRLAPQERAFFESHLEKVDTLEPLERVRIGGHATFSTPLRVRWSDLDSYRHVNNVRYFDYAQEARVDFMEQLGYWGSATPLRWMVVRQDVDYLQQMAFRQEPYEVQTAVQRVGRTSMTLAVEIRDGETPLAAARTILVCVGEDDRPAPLPDDLRTKIADWVL